MLNQLTSRPVARLGYAAKDLEAFVQACERRMAELATAIADAEARRDEALRQTAGAPALRRRIAEEWLHAWQEASSPVTDCEEVGE